MRPSFVPPDDSASPWVGLAIVLTVVVVGGLIVWLIVRLSDRW